MGKYIVCYEVNLIFDSFMRAARNEFSRNLQSINQIEYLYADFQVFVIAWVDFSSGSKNILGH